MFAVNFICGNLFLRIAGKIAKITTSKNFEPHGTSQTVLIRDIDNVWSIFLKNLGLE